MTSHLMSNGNAGHLGSYPIDQIVETLIDCEDLDAVIESNPGMTTEIVRTMESTLRYAFQNQEPNSLRATHKALCLMYEQSIGMPTTYKVANQYHPFLISLRNSIEKAWDNFELSRINPKSESWPASSQTFIPVFKQYVRSHPVSKHRLFDYLRNDAPREAFVQFFKHDCALNIRFYDIIVLALVGIDHAPRQELVKNLWDETGRGVEANTHTNLFKRVLEYVDEPLPRDNFINLPGWQGIAGYNLYLYLCMHRKNYYRLIGNMAVTELLDPPLYSKLMEGCQRVGLTDERALAYYREHIVQDVEHAEGWLTNVILPFVEPNPGVINEVMIGAEMRLNTCCDYYDYLYAELN